MKKIILAIVLVSSLVAWDEAKVVLPSWADMDGDTLWLKKEGQKPFKVRLIAIDTFETKFNHRVFKQLEVLKNIHPKKKHTVKDVIRLGHKAKDFVSKRYLGKKVKYYSYGKDDYGRELVWVEVLTYSLVREGWAVYYPNNKIHKKRKAYLLKLSREANLEQRGIYRR